MTKFCFVCCIGMKNFKATAISTAFRARAPANLSPTHLKSSSGQRNSHPAAILKRACFILECTVHMRTCASRWTLVTCCSLFSITHSAKYWHDKPFFVQNENLWIWSFCLQILGILMEVEQMEKTYEQMVSDLLNWLNTKIVELGRPFQKSMVAVQREMALFKHFRTVEKPPK